MIFFGKLEQIGIIKTLSTLKITADSFAKKYFLNQLLKSLKQVLSLFIFCYLSVRVYNIQYNITDAYINN